MIANRTNLRYDTQNPTVCSTCTYEKITDRAAVVGRMLKLIRYICRCKKRECM